MKGLVQFINESLSNYEREALFDAYIDVLDSNYNAEGEDFVDSVIVNLASGIDIKEFLENFLYDYEGLEWLEHRYHSYRSEIDAIIIRHAEEWLKDNGFE